MVDNCLNCIYGRGASYDERGDKAGLMLYCTKGLMSTYYVNYGDGEPMEWAKYCSDYRKV